MTMNLTVVNKLNSNTLLKKSKHSFRGESNYLIGEMVENPRAAYEFTPMVNQVINKIRLSLQTANSLYYRLVLVVGKTGSGKTEVIQTIAKEFGVSVINLNLVLSKELLELTAKQRALRLPEILANITENYYSPVFLDNIELLFDQDLKQDPLRLLQKISRNQTIVASWNGELKNRKLVYAEIDHPEYRSYNSVDVLIVSMDGTATVDLEKQGGQ